MGVSSNRIRLLTAAAAAAATIALSVASPARAFPDKEITLIVNYGAGGGTDLSSRVLAEAAEKILGQPIRVENKSGGGGSVGPSILSTAKPDGYTIGVTSFSPMAMTPHLQEVPYTLDSFDFIIGHARYRAGIAVAASSPYQTLDQLIADAKGGKVLTYATTSAQEDIQAAHLEDVLGIKLKRVSYKSGQESVTAAMSGVVDITMENPTNVVPQVKAGNLRLLASSSSVRWYELPDVPTLREQGVDVTSESFAGLAAPAGTPPDRLKRLEDAFAQALKTEEVQKTLKDLGMEPVYFSGAEYEQLLRDGYAAMGTDLAKLGLKKN
jgi:tripartite-type tricarboxylate transporter receptor subunit TctC